MPCADPTICANLVKILAECHETCTNVEKTNCKMYMRSDYTIECNGTHDTYGVLAGIVFAGAALGSPLILGSVLYQNRKRFLAQSPHSQYYLPDYMPGAFVRVTTRSFKMPRVYFCLLRKRQHGWLWLMVSLKPVPSLIKGVRGTQTPSNARCE